MEWYGEGREPDEELVGASSETREPHSLSAELPEYGHELGPRPASRLTVMAWHFGAKGFPGIFDAVGVAMAAVMAQPLALSLVVSLALLVTPFAPGAAAPFPASLRQPAPSSWETRDNKTAVGPPHSPTALIR